MGRKAKLRKERGQDGDSRSSQFLGMTVEEFVAFITTPRERPIAVAVMPDVFDHVESLFNQIRHCSFNDPVMVDICFLDFVNDRALVVRKSEPVTI